MTLKPRQHPHPVFYCSSHYRETESSSCVLLLKNTAAGMMSSSCVLLVKNTTAEIAPSSCIQLVKHYSRDNILIMCPIGDDNAALAACSSHVLTTSSHQCSNIHSMIVNTSVFFIIHLSSSNKLHSLSDLQ